MKKLILWLLAASSCALVQSTVPKELLNYTYTDSDTKQEIQACDVKTLNYEYQKEAFTYSAEHPTLLFTNLEEVSDITRIHAYAPFKKAIEQIINTIKNDTIVTYNMLSERIKNAKETLLQSLTNENYKEKERTFILEKLRKDAQEAYMTHILSLTQKFYEICAQDAITQKSLTNTSSEDEIRSAARIAIYDNRVKAPYASHLRTDGALEEIDPIIGPIINEIKKLLNPPTPSLRGDDTESATPSPRSEGSPSHTEEPAPEEEDDKTDSLYDKYYKNFKSKIIEAINETKAIKTRGQLKDYIEDVLPEFMIGDAGTEFRKSYPQDNVQLFNVLDHISALGRSTQSIFGQPLYNALHDNPKLEDDILPDLDEETAKKIRQKIQNNQSPLLMLIITRIKNGDIKEAKEIDMLIPKLQEDATFNQTYFNADQSAQIPGKILQIKTLAKQYLEAYLKKDSSTSSTTKAPIVTPEEQLIADIKALINNRTIITQEQISYEHLKHLISTTLNEAQIKAQIRNHKNELIENLAANPNRS